MSRVHVLMRSALVTRRPPEVGDYPVHRRAGETTWNREVGGVPPRADGSGPFAVDGLIGDPVSLRTLALLAMMNPPFGRKRRVCLLRGALTSTASLRAY
jgi:hypothetical protein